MGLGSVIKFHWEAPIHDLVRMASDSHYESCDFQGSYTLVPTGGVMGQMRDYYFQCATPGMAYLSCSVGGHCNAGQKLVVHVTSPQGLRSTSTSFPSSGIMDPNDDAALSGGVVALLICLGVFAVVRLLKISKETTAFGNNPACKQP